MLNSVEMTVEEASWYLLRRPLSKSSWRIQNIPTTWPHERTKVKKSSQQMKAEKLCDQSTNIWKKDLIKKY